MSACSRCGTDVLFVKRLDGTWAAPLVPSGVGLVIHNGVAFDETTYSYHECPLPETSGKQKHDAVQAQFARPDMNAVRLEHNRLAEMNECPKCDAKIGDPCVNLNKRKLGEPDVVTKWSHPERTPVVTNP